MQATLIFCCALSCFTQVEPHGALNPLYKQLREPGLTLTADQRQSFPAPTMPDGLDAAAQRAVIEQLAQPSYTYDDFTRSSLVAPHVLKIRELGKLDAVGRVQAVDLWLIAYGSLEQFRRQPDHDLMFKSRAGTTVHELTAAEAASRQLILTKRDDLEEHYTYAALDVFDKVQLAGTSHSVLSRTAESIVVAVETDGRFNQDAQFANAWRAIQRSGAQDITLGAPQPYQGFGSYFKATQLREPAGALLIEYHLIFLEPTSWFNGANLLRSKLPLAVQTEVRNFRRELKK